jgi:hypothetical protein
VDDIARLRSPEDVVLGCLLDKADVIFPLTLAEHIVTALRDAGMLRAPGEDG